MADCLRNVKFPQIGSRGKTKVHLLVRVGSAGPSAVAVKNFAEALNKVPTAEVVTHVVEFPLSDFTVEHASR